MAARSSASDGNRCPKASIVTASLAARQRRFPDASLVVVRVRSPQRGRPTMGRRAYVVRSYFEGDVLEQVPLPPERSRDRLAEVGHISL